MKKLIITSIIGLALITGCYSSNKSDTPKSSDIKLLIYSDGKIKINDEEIAFKELKPKLIEFGSDTSVLISASNSLRHSELLIVLDLLAELKFKNINIKGKTETQEKITIKTKEKS